jgi:plasmid stabilization system protein ParE
MKIEFSEESKQDFDDSFEYYKNENIELANRFKSDIKQSVKRIQTFPNLYPKINNKIHKCVATKFPYTIYYFAKDEKIFVLGIANHYRNPKTFIQRLNK